MWIPRTRRRNGPALLRPPFDCNCLQLKRTGNPREMSRRSSRSKHSLSPQCQYSSIRSSSFSPRGARSRGDLALSERSAAGSSPLVYHFIHRLHPHSYASCLILYLSPLSAFSYSLFLISSFLLSSDLVNPAPSRESAECPSYPSVIRGTER